MDKLIWKASSVLGYPLDSVQLVRKKISIIKITSLLDNISHPMNEAGDELESSFSGRLLHPKCTKKLYCRFFLPAAVI